MKFRNLPNLSRAVDGTFVSGWPTKTRMSKVNGSRVSVSSKKEYNGFLDRGFHTVHNNEIFYLLSDFMQIVAVILIATMHLICQVLSKSIQTGIRVREVWLQNSAFQEATLLHQISQEFHCKTLQLSGWKCSRCLIIHSRVRTEREEKSPR